MNTTAGNNSSESISRLAAWLLAARPKTLGAAAAPVVIGAAMAFGDGAAHWPAAASALLGALLIQIGTNFANDYFDFVKGADTVERVGPMRATQSGLISPDAMKWATVATFALALIPGAYVIHRGGLPLMLVGVVSILMGVLYTGGPHPLGYLGLGDSLVFVFFGPVAVGGTYYIQAQELTLSSIVAGAGPGLISVALLTINNLRDMDGDRKVGKKTLAVRFGSTFAKAEFGLSLLIASSIIPLYFFSLTQSRFFALLFLASSYISIQLIMALLRDPSPASLNRILPKTGLLLLVYAALFALSYNA